VGGSNPPPGPLSKVGAGRQRARFDWLRKLAAILLVLGGVTTGIVGLMFVTTGTWWGLALIAVTPAAIYAATRVTPEGGTTGYFDKNI
jgi:hypothetical protein